MELTKTINSGETRYHQTEQYWWLHNNTIPFIWDADNVTISKRKFNKWLDKLEIVHSTSSYDNPKSKMEIEEFFGVPKEIYSSMNGKIIIRFRKCNELGKDLVFSVRVFWDGKNLAIDQAARKYIDEIAKMVIYRANKSELHMVISDDSGLALRPFKINVPELDVELNYGKEWADKHQYLLEVLSRETKKGIALLHGLPGTGKSMYIRYLISILSKNRTLIYVPNQLINSITDPAFIPLIADYPNSILIIEDAEEAIKSRKQGGHTVDKILNLSDGIISDFLGTQIICTFNNDLTEIDEALLRKGRLILKHEFKKLTIEQSQKLSDKLGFTSKIENEMTLTEIYNQEDLYIDEKEEKSRIGFYRM